MQKGLQDLQGLLPSPSSPAVHRSREDPQVTFPFHKVQLLISDMRGGAVMRKHCSISELPL